MFVFVKRNTAYEMRISDGSSDVCSSDLAGARRRAVHALGRLGGFVGPVIGEMACNRMPSLSTGDQFRLPLGADWLRHPAPGTEAASRWRVDGADRKSTRLNSSH